MIAGHEQGLRILIVSASMGAGHTQTGNELERRLSRAGHETLHADFNQLMPRPTGNWLAHLYPWLVNSAPRLYDGIYRTFFLAPQRGGERAKVPTLLATAGLRRLVDAWRPQAVVSTFHLAALAAARLRGQGALGCPAITYITTFAVHNLWVHPETDLFLCVSSEATEDAAARSGRPAVTCGPPLRPEFDRSPETYVKVRDELDLPRDERIALVTTGSLGLGSAQEAAAAVEEHAGWTPVTVCGHNDDLRRQLHHDGRGVTLGWVDDMAGLMAAADALIDNAAGLSAKEALYSGLPVVTFRPIAGHGRDDTAALARLGLTDITHDPGELLRALDRLAEQPRERARRISHGRDLSESDPTAEIERLAADHAGGLACSRSA